jgi:poly-gamma-glutamate synthesis protein (capsule biosynthesis protein)
VLNAGSKGRVLLFSFGAVTSGIPTEWSATPVRPGVALLGDLSVTTAEQIAWQMRQFQQPGDLLVASIHWGANWGYDIPTQQIAFAHRLIEEGVAVVHSHSSHHVKAIEVFKERLILYGCGDFLSDYEGIGGYESFRDDLVLMYLVGLEQGSGRLLSARLVPFQMRRFRLENASEEDAEWLRALLNRLGASFGTRVHLTHPEGMILQW